MTSVYFVVLLLGGLAGLCMEEASIYFIKKRISEDIDYRFSGSLSKSLVWIMVGAASWFLIVLLIGFNVNTIECILILSICIVLSAVDITIRKIPNELVLITLIIGAIFIFIDNQTANFGLHIIGFVFGLLVFFAPSLIGKSAGYGDIKFAGAVGFCLGVYGFLTAMLIMAAILIIYTVYLMITGKGDLKTKVALGPFMATGFVSVFIINIVNNSIFMQNIFSIIQ